MIRISWSIFNKLMITKKDFLDYDIDWSLKQDEKVIFRQEIEGLLSKLITKYKVRAFINIKGTDVSFKASGELLEVRSELYHPLSFGKREDYVEFTIKDKTPNKYVINISNKQQGLEISMKDNKSYNNSFNWNDNSELKQCYILIGDNISINVDADFAIVEEIISDYNESLMATDLSEISTLKDKEHNDILVDLDIPL